MRAFQRERGLQEHGRCDESTWLALVESSWCLGDRPLRLVAPSMRGDDVVTLQAWLGRLGFDCGRVDGILGPATAAALVDFQRNCGLLADGICGSATIRALEINATRSGSGPGVATIRELEHLSTVGRTLRQLRCVVGQFGGFGPLVRLVAQDLRRQGAKVITTDELDPSAHAATANRYAATTYVGLEPVAGASARVAYYATSGFTSVGGRALAAQLAQALERAGSVAPARTEGMRLAVLRETRMTAVVCSLGPVQAVVDAAPVLSAAVVEALAAWAAAPVPAG